jgi:hypothetical protein
MHRALENKNINLNYFEKTMYLVVNLVDPKTSHNVSIIGSTMHTM